MLFYIIEIILLLNSGYKDNPLGETYSGIQLKLTIRLKIFEIIEIMCL